MDDTELQDMFSRMYRSGFVYKTTNMKYYDFALINFEVNGPYDPENPVEQIDVIGHTTSIFPKEVYVWTSKEISLSDFTLFHTITDPNEGAPT